MVFAVLFSMSAVMVGAGWSLTVQLTPENGQAERLRWLRNWSLKALLVPLAFWALMNVGLSWDLRPFMPQIQAAQNSGKGWGTAFCRVLLYGLFIISSWWTAGTLAWALAEAAKKAEGESIARFRGLCWLCGFGMGLPALAIAWFGGWTTYGFALNLVLVPIAGYAPPILHTKKRPPVYARAIARMKFGKYSEAEWEIIHELENCEDDFQGWMMLAELHAHHFHDLSEAEKIVLEACSQPGTTPSQLATALHRLADWHVKLHGDPENARWSLQIICDRLKGTHLAHMAQLRINQLPRNAQELREQQEAKPIPLPALGDSLDEKGADAAPKMERHKAAHLANECVEKLKDDPNNVAAREKLARLFAEQLDRADLGIEQLKLLLEMPDQPEPRRAEWWGLVAAWHIKYRHDGEAAREVLERIVREFPNTPQTLAAQRRIRLLETEQRERARARPAAP
ncbi:MAG TPA: hypothetical protein VMU04_08300 [Candidatus Acidoferrum sp.]|nr:hypothetical protein [Candidatus Acidoferrum sp.]